jgi:hypothetical protein
MVDAKIRIVDLCSFECHGQTLGLDLFGRPECRLVPAIHVFGIPELLRRGC